MASKRVANGQLVELLRRLLWWAALLVVIAHLISSSLPDDDERPELENSSADDQGLRIVALEPDKVGPGAHLAVTIGSDPEFIGRDVVAQVGSTVVESIHQAGDSYVFELPESMTLGRHAVTIAVDGERSHPWYVEVVTPSRRKLVRNVLGGMALLLLGLQFLSRGIRRLAGHELRSMLGGRAAGRARGAFVGLVTGILGQMAATTGGLISTLLGHRMLALSGAVTVWIWAHLGSSLAGAALPVFPVREALALVALGVAWTLLANHRQARALARVVLGLGLVFHGVHLLRVGFATLVSAPEALPYLAVLHPEIPTELLTCVLLGALACTILQGPGPVFIVVAGLTASTGAVALPAALAIVSGGWLGTGLVGVIVSWTAGTQARRASVLHFALAAIGVLVIVPTLDLWLDLAGQILGTNPSELEYGKKVLLPNASSHLGLAFVSAQLAAVLLTSTIWAALGGRIVNRVESSDWLNSWAQRSPAPAGGTGTPQTQLPESASLAQSHDILEIQREAVRGCLDLVETHRRGRAAAIESALIQSRSGAQQLMISCSEGDSGASLLGGTAEQPVTADGPIILDLDSGASAQLAGAVMSLVQLHHAIATVFYFSEALVESASEARDGDLQTLRRMAGLLLEGYDALIECLAEARAIDFESVQAREIAMNGIETNHRSAELAKGRHLLAEDLESRVVMAQLVTAYEAAGNQLFRSVQAFDGLELA